jgi:hypothetical protein
MDILMFPANRKLIRRDQVLARAQRVLVARIDELQCRCDKAAAIDLIEAIYMIHDLYNISRLNGE